jgi:hypothetical protein
LKPKSSPIVFRKSKVHALSYTRPARQKIREHPEILREFLKMVATQQISEIKTEKFYIKRLPIKENRSDAGYHTNLYSLDFFVNGKAEKYFIKELDINDFFRLQKNKNLRYDLDIKAKIKEMGVRGFGGSDGFSESLALKIISESGVVGRRLEVVDSVFSYVDAINKKSFICYKYMDLKTVNELILENKISFTKKESIERFLAKVAARVESYLEKNYAKYGFKKAPQILDISPHNVFYDPVKDKLYLFDALLLS